MKLSQWHPAHVKPVHVGVYETNSENMKAIAFNFWNGRTWSETCATKELAIESRNDSVVQNILWRGIAK